MEEKGAAAAVELQQPRGRHIKKRSLKNKALSISFNEKDLRDYVTGFHKRKKKRRKEAEKQQEEAKRRKRIEDRKKRKLEKEYVLYGPGGAPPPVGDGNEDQVGDGVEEPTTTVSGTTTYDNGELQVTVRTSEISREEEEEIRTSEKTQAAEIEALARDKKHNLPVSKKKPFKKAGKHKARPKRPSKVDRKKGKKKNKKIR